MSYFFLASDLHTLTCSTLECHRAGLEFFDFCQLSANGFQALRTDVSKSDTGWAKNATPTKYASAIFTLACTVNWIFGSITIFGWKSRTSFKMNLKISEIRMSHWGTGENLFSVTFSFGPPCIPKNLRTKLQQIAFLSYSQRRWIINVNEVFFL